MDNGIVGNSEKCVLGNLVLMIVQVTSKIRIIVSCLSLCSLEGAQM